MSHYATAFIVVNLGCEMIYVIEQRLKAQNIPKDKSDRVLTDITTVLLHPKLLHELFIPQPVATHKVVKQLLQDISSTSIMKLDDYSINKLWDLMTMIFKWQISVAQNQNIFDITRRHIKSVATVMPVFYPKTNIEQTMQKFNSLREIFSDNDYNAMKNTMIVWFSEYHTKISILIRLGLQGKDGTFKHPTSIHQTILDQLGDNIYKYDNKKKSLHNYESEYADMQEISCLLGSVEHGATEKREIELHLPFEIEGKEINKSLKITQHTSFENINTRVKSNFGDLSFSFESDKTPQESLCEMLNDESNN